MFKIELIFFVLLSLTQLSESKFSKVASWKQLKFRDNVDPQSRHHITIPYNNVPFGIAVHKSRVFVGVARRRVGVPSTLNYIYNADGKRNSQLISYPDFRTNQITNAPSTNKIVSVYRPRVDSCDRLWFVDTGALEYDLGHSGNQPPSIWIINLNTDTVIKKFSFPSDAMSDGVGLSSITIDVVSSENYCDNSFAYIPDWQNNVLWVYDFKENKAWRFQHNYFNFDPLGGDFNVNGLQFAWNDGLFSVALSEKDNGGFRKAYFSALCSFNEFFVSTEVLKNESLSQRAYHGDDFKFLGTKGPRTQSAAHYFDENSKVMFFSEVQKNSISCWKADSDFNADNIHLIKSDDESLFYPTDLLIDNQSNLWVLANKLPKYIYSELNVDEDNFFIWKGKVSEVIQGTRCEGRFDQDQDGIVFKDE